MLAREAAGGFPVSFLFEILGISFVLQTSAAIIWLNVPFSPCKKASGGNERGVACQNPANPSEKISFPVLVRLAPPRHWLQLLSEIEILLPDFRGRAFLFPLLV